MVTANRFWSQVFGVAFSNSVVPVAGLWARAIGVIELAQNLRAYDFVIQELRAAERISAMYTLYATWNPYATGTELDDHYGFDRSMRCLAYEGIPCNAKSSAANTRALLGT